MTRVVECALCGAESDRVRSALVEYTDAIRAGLGRPYDVVPRCDDRPACRRRVEAIGEVWPLNDGTESASTSTAVAP
jgi:hypothetical protein